MTNTKSRTYDVVTVGGATMDLFLQTEDSRIIDLRDKHDTESFLSFEYGQKIYLDQLRSMPGGGGNNTAVSFARLGLKVAYLGVVGEDEEGRRLLANLKKEGVFTDLVKRLSDRQTGLSVILNSFEGDRTVFSYRGTNNDLAPEHIDWKQLESARWIYLPSISGPAAETLTDQLVAFAAEHEIQLACNPGSAQLQRGTQGLAHLLKHTNVLILNRREAEQLTGLKARHLTIDEDLAPLEVMHGEPWISNVGPLMKQLHDMGVDKVVITEGVKGSHFSDGKQHWWMPVYPFEATDSLGAGDAFGSTFLAYLIEGAEPLNALKAATANSAAVVQVFGSQTGLCSRADVQAMVQAHAKLEPLLITDQLRHLK